MVAKVKSLDTYTRQMVAPLGIVFPFPLHCSKLDCYMNAALVDKGRELDEQVVIEMSFFVSSLLPSSLLCCPYSSP